MCYIEETSSSLIEGISDTVLYLVTFTVIILLIYIVIWYRQSNQTQLIHPNHHEQVQSIRERILNSDQHQERTPRIVHREERCPICIDHYSFPVETNCGHVFCSACLFSYYEHGGWINAMNCPVCRQQVNVVLPDFSHEEEVSDNVAEHLDKIRSYNRRYSGEPRPIWDYIMDFPVLARHLFRNFFSVAGLVTMLRLRIVLYLLIVVIYVLSPLDIIPEAVLGILGMFDDLAIAAVILVYITVLFRHSLAA